MVGMISIATNRMTNNAKKQIPAKCREQNQVHRICLTMLTLMYVHVIGKIELDPHGAALIVPPVLSLPTPING